MEAGLGDKGVAGVVLWLMGDAVRRVPEISPEIHVEGPVPEQGHVGDHAADLN